MKPLNVAQKLITLHLVVGKMTPGSEIGFKIDQALFAGRYKEHWVQFWNWRRWDLIEPKTEVRFKICFDQQSLQTEFLKNADVHLFWFQLAQKFGLMVIVDAGNGVSHPVAIWNVWEFRKDPSRFPIAIAVQRVSWECWPCGTGGWMVAACHSRQPYFVKMPKDYGCH